MEAKEKLIAALVEYYGTRAEKDMDELLLRIDLTVTALVFAGNQGDNPMCELNRLFEEIVRKG